MSTTALESAPLTCPTCGAARTLQIGGDPDGYSVVGWDYACGSFWLRGAPQMHHPLQCKIDGAKKHAAKPGGAS